MKLYVDFGDHDYSEYYDILQEIASHIDAGYTEGYGFPVDWHLEV